MYTTLMSTIFIFHGTGGHPQENWLPWLKAELEKQSHTVIVPAFPTPEGQSLDAWLAILETYSEQIQADSILIGHSLGGLFLLRVLEQLKHPVKAAIFVAAPIGIKPIRNYDADQAFSPSGFNFDWETIKLHAKQFVVFHSDTDPYISRGNGEQLAAQLGVPLTFIPDAGHFNAAAGYTKFERLFEIITHVDTSSEL